MKMRMDYTWEPGGKYNLTIDSLGVTDIYGEHNGPFKHEFTVRKVEDYSNILFHITGLQGSRVVQLLSTADNPLMQAKVEDGTAVFRYVLPGKYFARLFADQDSSGTYTPGSLTLNRMPEDVYYFPKRINLKKNWDLEQQWNINEQPVDLQKPAEIKKNKPKPKPVNCLSNNSTPMRTKICSATVLATVLHPVEVTETLALMGISNCNRRLPALYRAPCAQDFINSIWI